MGTPSPLPSSRLHATYDPALIPVDDSTQFKLSQTPGRIPYQDRAMKALDLALNIRADGFNVYLAGSSNIGRSHIVRNYLTPVAKKLPTPPDQVYVYNFKDTDKPVLILLPPGQGRKFRLSMQEVMKSVCSHMEHKLHGAGYLKQRAQIVESYHTARNRLLDRMNRIAVRQGFNMDFDESGNITLFPIIGGQRVGDDEFAKMDQKLQRELKSRSSDLIQNMSGYVQELTRTEEGFQDKEKDLEKAMLTQVLDQDLRPLSERMDKLCRAAGLERSAESLATYFEDVRKDMTENTQSLLAPKPKPPFTTIVP